MEQANGRLTLIMHGNGDEKLLSAIKKEFYIDEDIEDFSMDFQNNGIFSFIFSYDLANCSKFEKVEDKLKKLVVVAGSNIVSADYNQVIGGHIYDRASVIIAKRNFQLISEGRKVEYNKENCRSIGLWYRNSETGMFE
jgi:hypothetical protein